MEIQSGLFEQIVLQRTKGGVSDANVAGRCGAAGVVLARVSKGGAPLRGLNGAAVGRAKGGKFTARLRGIPAGGPYHVELCIKGSDEAVNVSGVLVGDVWLVGGQSNMQGCGRATQRAKPHPQVRAFYMDDHWAVAEDPIHQLEIAVDHFHNNGVRAAKPGKNANGVGPAVAFGRQMLLNTGVPQGLIACAHGGTSMTQWDPALKKIGGKSLYGAAARRLKKNGGKVAGVIWYQGESDAGPDAAKLFTARMKKLVAAFRRDAGDRALPFVQVQISRVVGWTTGPDWNSIQDQQRRLDRVIKNVATVPAIDLALDDSIHIGGADQQRLGKRLAYAMNVLRRGRAAGKPPIALKRITTDTDPVSNLGVVTIEFDHVVGSLTGHSRPVGFALSDGTLRQAIFDTQLNGNKAVIRTTMPKDSVASLGLHYGFGTDPICNITDQADRSLPVFGPSGVGTPRALTPFAQSLRVAGPLPSAGKLHRLKAPRGKLPWRKVAFPTGMCDVHLELAKLGAKDTLYWFACTLDCPRPMRLRALLGYDGPVKLFVDGKERFHDPNGTNPAHEDARKIPLALSRGKHEIAVGLGTNNNKAWGIFLRFERLGVSNKLLAQGPDAYPMPKMLG